jgi:dTDP-4-amino-4,6-dideoxygalactose transaminase
VNYPVALPFLPAYARLKHGPQDYPVAHRNQTRILSLPIYPEMQPAQLDSLVDALHRFGG